MIAYLIIGMSIGLLLAGAALLSGTTFLAAFLVYSLGGSFTVIAMSTLVYFRVATKVFPTSQAAQRHRSENA
jgi:hypothetical protein